MATLVLVQGPAGGGKSQVVAEMMEAGEVLIFSDITALWAALCAAVRGEDGKYPEREDDDPCLQIAIYLQEVAAQRALQEGYDVAVTTSQRHQEGRWREVVDTAALAAVGAATASFLFRVVTVDPGREVVERRLSDANGNLSQQCRKAIGRWYD